MPGVSLYREHFVTKCNKYCKKNKKINKKKAKSTPGVSIKCFTILGGVS